MDLYDSSGNPVICIIGNCRKCGAPIVAKKESTISSDFLFTCLCDKFQKVRLARDNSFQYVRPVITYLDGTNFSESSWKLCGETRQNHCSLDCSFCSLLDLGGKRYIRISCRYQEVIYEVEEDKNE